VTVAVLVGAEVADVLGGAERRASLLQQKDGVVAVGQDVAGGDVEDVEAALPRTWRARSVVAAAVAERPGRVAAFGTRG